MGGRKRNKGEVVRRNRVQRKGSWRKCGGRGNMGGSVREGK